MMRCNTRFQHLRFQSDYFDLTQPTYYFENATACIKCTMKTCVAMHLN